MKPAKKMAIAALMLTATLITMPATANADGTDNSDVVAVYYAAGLDAMEKGYLDVAESRFLASARYALSNITRGSYREDDLNRSLRALADLYDLQGERKKVAMVHQISAVQ